MSLPVQIFFASKILCSTPIAISRLQDIWLLSDDSMSGVREISFIPILQGVLNPQKEKCLSQRAPTGESNSTTAPTL